jgi:hypothetical protein
MSCPVIGGGGAGGGPLEFVDALAGGWLVVSVFSGFKFFISSTEFNFRIKNLLKSLH